LLQEAITLDPMFGAAYRKLGTAMGNNGGPAGQRRPMYDKAYELRDRMTERERLLATAGYYASGSHPDRALAGDAYQTLVDRYPDEGPALQNFAQLSSSRHQFAKSESLYLRRIEVDSTQQFAPFNVILSQLSQGRIDPARASITRARQLFPEHDRVPHSAENRSTTRQFFISRPFTWVSGIFASCYSTSLPASSRAQVPRAIRAHLETTTKLHRPSGARLCEPQRPTPRRAGGSTPGCHIRCGSQSRARVVV